MRYLQTIVFTMLLIGSCCISAYAQTRLSKADGTKSGTIDWGLSQRDLNVLSGTDILKKVDFPSNKAELEAKANSGEPLANLLLGLAYQNGIGFEKNEGKGAQLVEIAASAGQPRAMFSLGFFRENGIGLPKSPQIAAQWYRKSSDAGNARGMYALGQILSEGVVLPKNDTEAAQLFRKSAEAGFDPARVAWAYALSDGVGVDIDQQSALKWYRAAADLGNSGGMLNVGIMYHAGRGIRQDFVQAHSWYKKSAIASNMDGMFALAKSYAFGEGVTKDSGESDRWLQAAVKAGHKEAREMVTADLAAQPKIVVVTQPSAIVNGTTEESTFVKNGWDISTEYNFILATPNVQPIYRLPGQNCSSGIFHGIVVFVPDDFPLFDSVGRHSSDLKPNLFSKLSKLAPLILKKADRQCSYLFRLSIVRIGIYNYCLKNSLECKNGLLPQQSFKECPGNEFINTGFCASRYDVGLVSLYATGAIENGISLFRGPETLARKLAERDRISQGKDVHAAAVQAEAAKRRLSFKQQSLALVPQSQKTLVTAVLSHMVTGGSPCFNVYDGARTGISGKGIQLCDKFALLSVRLQTVSSADAANGITQRFSVRASYIYTQGNSVNWTDASICYNIALKSGAGWRFAGSC